MPSIDLRLEGDGCWTDLTALHQAGRLIPLMGHHAPHLGLALLANGMASGKPSVSLRIDLPDGRTLLTETSLDLLETALKAMRAYLAGKAEQPQPPHGSAKDPE